MRAYIAVSLMSLSDNFFLKDGGRGYIVEKTKAKMMYRRLDNLADKALLMVCLKL